MPPLLSLFKLLFSSQHVSFFLSFCCFSVSFKIFTRKTSVSWPLPGPDLALATQMAEEPPPSLPQLWLTDPARPTAASSSSSSTITPWYVNDANSSKMGRPLARELGVDYAKAVELEGLDTHIAHRGTTLKGRRRTRRSARRSKISKESRCASRPSSCPPPALRFQHTAIAAACTVHRCSYRGVVGCLRA